MPQRNERILAVDDDPLLCEIVSAKLQGDGYAVECAEDGMAARNRIESGRFDLVITDLEMPRMDGFDLIAELRSSSQTRTLPIVVLTGSQDAGACRRAYEAGATSFITKPVNWPFLTNEIAYVLRNARNERDLLVAKRQAEAALRLKDHILSVIGHELRTPLHSITGFAKLMTDAVHGPLGHAGYTNYAREIETAGKSLNTRINDMILLSRLSTDEDNFETDLESVSELLCSVRSAFRIAGSLDVIKEIKLDDADMLATYSVPLLTTALRQLVDNALKFGGENVSITIGAREAPDAIVFFVTDDGPGIPANIVDKCLTPFGQANMKLDRHGEGMGLGLTIASAVARKHGGRLSISASETGGTTVEIVLPICPSTIQFAEAV